ncbi:FAD:protein FMN transferase [Cytophagales bacterium WSM2-2]|nr:FAD:protein FMN transferase [Cytophagales bacterium WSM2-2]
MGSPLTLIFYCDDSLKAAAFSTRSFHLVDSLVNIFSDYIDESELNQLCRSVGTTFKCSPALFEILKLSQDAYAKSEGTFDITLGPVTQLWRKARAEKKIPEASQVKEKIALTGFSKIKLDTIAHTATLTQKGMRLDLGGIAQGFIAQQVIDFLKKCQVKNALIDVSGDIVCIGNPPNAKGWTVGISVPGKENQLLQKQLLITNSGVTTSGDVYQYIEHEGKRYSHIVDPLTGYGITTQRNVTVIASDGTLADWLTKACSLLPVAKAKKLAARLNTAVLITEMKKGKLVFYASNNFKQFWKTPKK